MYTDFTDPRVSFELTTPKDYQDMGGTLRAGKLFMEKESVSTNYSNVRIDKVEIAKK